MDDELIVLRYVGAMTIAAASIYAIADLVHQPYRCQLSIAQSIRDTAALMRSTNSAGVLEGSREIVKRLRSCERWYMCDVNLHMVTAANQAMQGNPAAARDEYLRALRCDRRPEIYFELGKQYLELGETDKAFNSLMRACVVNPAWTEGVPEPMRGRLNSSITAARNDSAIRLRQQPTSSYSPTAGEPLTP